MSNNSDLKNVLMAILNGQGKKAQFAVKRGRVLTTFQHVTAAFTYWRQTLGGVLLQRDQKGHWAPVV